ncbi:MAG: N-acyl homoserine lactonase family protein [Syntrophobacteraceae bacterium]|jgi:glyoxylase-like metal-dependent hydrolase (beta-lactamase superfamily II)
MKEVESKMDRPKSKHKGKMVNNESDGNTFVRDVPKYEVYALKYGEFHFYPMYLWHWMGKPALSPSQPLTPESCYFWLIKGPDINILFDTGCTPEMAKAHQIVNYEDHKTVLGKIGLKPEDIGAVIISHAHFDHVSGIQVFQEKNIPFYIQETCFRWTVEEYPKYPLLKKLGIPDFEDVQWLSRMLFADRLKLLAGERAGKAIEIFPGVSVRRVDGHMMGLQIAIVQTARGPVVLASDAAYLYSNLEMDWPVGLHMSTLTDAMDAIAVCKESGKIVVPGHDSEVEKKFPEVKPGVYKIA